MMMRDEIPTGAVCRIIKESAPGKSPCYEFSNPHLAALAADYADRLFDETSEVSELAESD